MKIRSRNGTSGLGLALLLACSCSQPNHTPPTSTTPTGSAIDVVQRVHHATRGTSITTTFPNGPANVGDVIVAVLGVENDSDPIVFVPSGFTSAFTLTRGGVYWKASDGTEASVTVRIHGKTARDLSLTSYELSGIDPAMPVDAYGGATFSSPVTSVIASTDTPTIRTGGYAIAEVYMNGTNGDDVTATDGFEVVDSSTRRIAVEKSLSATGTISTTFGWTTPRAGSWVLIALTARSA